MLVEGSTSAIHPHGEPHRIALRIKPVGNRFDRFILRLNDGAKPQGIGLLTALKDQL